jgi:hypothetical protein
LAPVVAVGAAGQRGGGGKQGRGRSVLAGVGAIGAEIGGLVDLRVVGRRCLRPGCLLGVECDDATVAGDPAAVCLGSGRAAGESVVGR